MFLSQIKINWLDEKDFFVKMDYDTGKGGQSIMHNAQFYILQQESSNMVEKVYCTSVNPLIYKAFLKVIN